MKISNDVKKWLLIGGGVLLLTIAVGLFSSDFLKTSLVPTSSDYFNFDSDKDGYQVPYQGEIDEMTFSLFRDSINGEIPTFRSLMVTFSGLPDYVIADENSSYKSSSQDTWNVAGSNSIVNTKYIVLADDQIETAIGQDGLPVFKLKFEMNPEYTGNLYSKTVNYTAELTDGDFNTYMVYGSFDFTFMSPDDLSVSATATPDRGDAPLEVALDATITGGVSPYSYYWRIKKTYSGEVSTEVYSGEVTVNQVDTVNHLFQDRGFYTNEITVNSTDGQSAQDSVHVFSGPAPVVPTNLRGVSNYPNGIDADWDDVEPSYSYRFDAKDCGLSQNCDSDYNLIYNTTTYQNSLNIPHNLLIAGNYYLLTVVSDVNGWMSSPATVIVQYTPSSTEDYVPQNVVAIAYPYSSDIFVRWDPIDSTRLSGYNIYRAECTGSTGTGSTVGDMCDENNLTYVKVGETSGSVVFVDTSSESGHTYVYAISSIVGGEESEMSDPSDPVTAGVGGISIEYLILPYSTQGTIKLEVSGLGSNTSWTSSESNLVTVDSEGNISMTEDTDDGDDTDDELREKGGASLVTASDGKNTGSVMVVVWPRGDTDGNFVVGPTDQNNVAVGWGDQN